jgi:hypothetical protein
MRTVAIDPMAKMKNAAVTAAVAPPFPIHVIARIVSRPIRSWPNAPIDPVGHRIADGDCLVQFGSERLGALDRLAEPN